MSTPPTSAAAAAQALYVGRWRVDAAADEIESDGRVVKLEPLQMRLLMCLVDRAGQVVLTQDVLDLVWGDLVVTPNSVYQAVAQLRRQLGANGDGDEATYIQTLHRKGYRLVAPVRRVDAAIGAPMPAKGDGAAIAGNAAMPMADAPVEAQSRNDARTPSTPASPAVNPARRRLLRRTVLTTGAAATAATVAWFVFRTGPRGNGGSPRIAVLPFVDGSDGKSEQALARGLANDVIRDLGRYRELQALAADSMQGIPAETDGDMAEAARKLDAQVLVVGRLTRAGTGVRVNLRVLRMPGARTLFEREYRASIETASELPTNMARETAAALGINPPTQPPIAAEASQAYELFVLGNDAWQARTQDAFAKARHYFQRGIEADPNYSRNYVGLGWTWIGQATNGAGIDMPRAVALATPLFERALVLAPDSADALAAQATLHTLAGEHDKARQLLERAIMVQPNYSQAHHSLGLLEFDSGWPLRAVAHFERAARLNPLSAAPLDRLALAQLFSGQAPAAVATARKAIEVRPQHPNGHWSLGIAGYATGDLALGVRSYKQALELDARRPFLWQELARLYLDLEMPDAAAAAFARTVEQLPGTIWPPVYATYAWVSRRERGATPAALERIPETGLVVEVMQIRAMAGLPIDAVGLKRALDATTARGEVFRSEPWFLFQGTNRTLDLATVLVAVGDVDGAKPHIDAATEQLARLEKQGNRWHTLKFHQARALALQGKKVPALDALDAAVAAGWRRGWWLELDPALAGLRAEPRFQAARSKIHEIVTQQKRQLEL